MLSFPSPVKMLVFGNSFLNRNLVLHFPHNAIFLMAAPSELSFDELAVKSY